MKHNLLHMTRGESSNHPNDGRDQIDGPQDIACCLVIASGNGKARHCFKQAKKFSMAWRAL